MERFNVLARPEGQPARAIELDQALAVLSGLDYNPCPIPSFFVVVSVLDEYAGPCGEGGNGP